MIILHALHQRCKVRGGVERCAVRFDENAGGNLFFIGRFLYLYHQCALTLMGQTGGAEMIQHIGDVFLRIAFAEPCIKVDIQPVGVLFQPQRPA